MQLSAQEDGVYYTSRDLSTWSTASFRLKISENLSFTVSEQFRFKTNSSELDLFFTQLKGQYSFDNGLSFGGGYRFIGDKTDNSGDLDWEQRFHADLGYKFKIDRFNFEARLRGQTRDDIGEKRTEDGDYGRRALRLKLQTEYDIKKWKFDPVVSAEIYRANGKYVSPSFDKFRATIGTNYKFKYAGQIGVFYRFETDLNTDYGLNHNIIGFKYKFTLKTYNTDEWK